MAFRARCSKEHSRRCESIRQSPSVLSCPRLPCSWTLPVRTTRLFEKPSLAARLMMRRYAKSCGCWAFRLRPYTQFVHGLTKRISCRMHHRTANGCLRSFYGALIFTCVALQMCTVQGLALGQEMPSLMCSSPWSKRISLPLFETAWRGKAC